MKQGTLFRLWRFVLYHSNIPGPGGTVYMRRWILDTPWGTVRLHNILQSDDDRGLHDHPWDFVSLILTGGYWETRVRPGGDPCDERTFECRCFGPFHLNRKRAEEAHRLILDRAGWTLVLSGPVRRRWGFYVPGRGWVYWRDFVNENDHYRNTVPYKPDSPNRNGDT